MDPIEESDSVEDVLTRYPAAAAVFLAHRMACVGCFLARFQRIRDAAVAYGLDTALLVAELREAAGANGSAPTQARDTAT